MTTLLLYGVRRRFNWETQLKKGEEGVAALVAHLRSQGRTVHDLAQVRAAQSRGIDLLVDDEAWEVKSDFHAHAPGAAKLFLEVSCNGKPGCIFMSRADVLAYTYPNAGVCYLLRMADIQHWLALCLGDFPLKTVTSTRNGRQWTAKGIVAPVALMPHEVVTWTLPSTSMSLSTSRRQALVS